MNYNRNLQEEEKEKEEKEREREKYAVMESFIIQSQNNEMVYINSRPVYTATYKAHKGQTSQY